mmetsp:Transcript_83989/g.246324  ORF Transcript_83989/g.246324 Transcript_83989/m.246324 type:complete len:208 (+) Transcript_83989:1436-2059(+)
MRARAFFSSAYTSSASFFLASSRKRTERLEALVSRGSYVLRLACSFRTSSPSQACKSTSAPAEMPFNSSLASATASRASFTSSSVLSDSLSISAETMEAPFAGSGASPWIVVTFSPMDSIVFPASLSFSCSWALSSASLFSFASLAAFRSVSMTFSRAIPTDTFIFWNKTFFTPFSPSSIKAFHIKSIAALGTVKSNSPFAYLRTSF